MTQEQKNLLLKDLCARLPYGVKCQVQEDEYTDIRTLCRIEVDDKNGDLLDFVESTSGLDCQVYLSEVKPYLFPLSSMTEEQKKDLLLTTVGEKGLKLFSVTKDGIISNNKEEQSFANFSVNWINFSNKNVKAYIGWLIKNHFDIHDLIPMGLAIDATDKNIYDR